MMNAHAPEYGQGIPSPTPAKENSATGLDGGLPAVPKHSPRRKTPTKRNFTPTEHAEQAMLIQWARLASGARPELRLLYAVPNAAKRSVITASRMKTEGMKAGVPDLCLPVARGTHHGLYIEMKRQKGGTVSPEQREWIDALTAQGYRVEVCKGFVAAREVIEDYLPMGDVHRMAAIVGSDVLNVEGGYVPGRYALADKLVADLEFQRGQGGDVPGKV